MINDNQHQCHVILIIYNSLYHITPSIFLFLLYILEKFFSLKNSICYPYMLYLLILAKFYNFN
jgi:hypothetical protein